MTARDFINKDFVNYIVQKIDHQLSIVKENKNIGQPEIKSILKTLPIEHFLEKYGFEG
jgi:hypothetical protein